MVDEKLVISYKRIRIKERINRLFNAGEIEIKNYVEYET